MKFFYISFLYLTYFNLYDANSEPSCFSKNLIFVYDTINPGIEYVDFVQGVVEIYYELFQTRKIFNKILIVFPLETSIETITFDYETNIEKSVEEYLLQERSWIVAEKNTCTESKESRVLTGLWVGLYSSEPNSLVYVITKAKPEIRPMMHMILGEIEDKLIEVGFIIQQDFQEYEISQEYQEISLRSNGLILNVHSDSKIMTFLPDLLTTQLHKVNLMTINNHPSKCHTILVDEYLEEITIASWTWGSSEQYIINHFNHSEYSWISTHPPHRNRFLGALKTKVQSYTVYPSGDLYINVDTNSYLFGLRVFGTSGFNFNYGFSVDEWPISCVNKILHRPIMYTQNYIYISSTCGEYEAVFTSCVIIAIDNSFVREIPLQKISSNSEEDLYYGTFLPGSEAFYIRVTAFINGKIVQRMSSVAISPFREETSRDKQIYYDIELSTDYTNTTYNGNSRPKRQIIKFI